MNFRLMTYNIHRAIGIDRRFRLDRIVKIIADNDADIVLLQEVDEGVPRSLHMNLAHELARELGYPHYALGHNVNLRQGRYGNATLSRFPILRERNIDLTIGHRKARGCQHTTIRVPLGESLDGDQHGDLEVFNLHLGLSARERRHQAVALSRSEEFTTLQDDTACLLGGDFNDWRSLLRTFFVQNLRFHCATDRTERLRPQALKTYPSFSPSAAPDRIYFRGMMKLLSVKTCRQQIARIASDHLPVTADFLLEQRRAVDIPLQRPTAIGPDIAPQAALSA